MHDSNHTDDFEQYLQEQVDDHRMYPSDRVWKNIRGRVHTPKKWPALSVFTVLIISALVIGTILNKPAPDLISPNFVYSLQNSGNAQNPKPAEESKNITSTIPNNYAIDQITTRTVVAAVEKIKIDEAISRQFAAINKSLVLDNAAIKVPQNSVGNNTSSIQNTIAKNEPLALVNVPDNTSLSFKNIDNYLFDVTSRLKSILNTQPVHVSNGGAAFFISDKNQIPFEDFDFKVSPTYKDLLPSFDNIGKNSSRFDFRFYVTPSVSYRRLKEKNQNTNSKNSGAALESAYRVSPSKAINQTPALGYETGLGLGYKLSNKLSLTGGFQFNISQYKINAFLYKDEPVAVTLNEGAYASTINTVSSLRSVPGNAPLTIKNRYYELSVPVGIEWQILNSGRFNWGLGASIQPTYTFDKQPLIISSNYKNYADGSAYVRNWNINGNIETFLGYTTGSYRWQVGPQLRYQALPSLVDKYPNKEYLFNYGLKFGVVKQLK